ncbi:hypothetical protein QKW52_14570 [Bacillus sonorensis]|nr:hypothetical protein [Bacillus sonorensis]
MTEQQKSSLKIISAVLIVILLPVLFFHFIGENPTKKVSNETKEIAVVNEDIGSDQGSGNDEKKCISAAISRLHWLNGPTINGRSSAAAPPKADSPTKNMMRLSTFHQTLRTIF